MINFKNKKILITGATGGIGGELVKKFISLKGEVLATGTNEENNRAPNAIFDPASKIIGYPTSFIAFCVTLSMFVFSFVVILYAAI